VNVLLNSWAYKMSVIAISCTYLWLLLEKRPFDITVIMLFAYIYAHSAYQVRAALFAISIYAHPLRSAGPDRMHRHARTENPFSVRFLYISDATKHAIIERRRIVSLVRRFCACVPRARRRPPLFREESRRRRIKWKIGA
jgi:hypothetical protein